jgi:phosphatidylinositol kinase/protein kinase (PI-3  family)
MDNMRVHRPNMVEQAQLVSQELIRVSILWHEMWHEGLEEASRLYFSDHNVEGMFAVLAPLHAMMERVSHLINSTHMLVDLRQGICKGRTLLTRIY